MFAKLFNFKTKKEKNITLPEAIIENFEGALGELEKITDGEDFPGDKGFNCEQRKRLDDELSKTDFSGNKAIKLINNGHDANHTPLTEGQCDAFIAQQRRGAQNNVDTFYPYFGAGHDEAKIAIEFWKQSRDTSYSKDNQTRARAGFFIHAANAIAKETALIEFDEYERKIFFQSNN